MDAHIIHVKGMTLMGRGKSGHWVAMDGPVKYEGSESATRPKELILISLGGCTGSDVISILKKMRENVTRLEIEIEAEEEKEKHPRVYTKIHIIYKLWGDSIKKEAVEKAINLSQDRYCPVSAMLKKTVELSSSYHINPE
jgi:putative redox protein